MTLRLRLALDEVKTEHLRRPKGDAREDLLQTLDALRGEAVAVKIPAFVIAALSRTAEILLDLNRPKDALAILNDAYCRLGERDPQGQGADLLCKQARAYALLGDWKSTSAVCERGIQIVEYFRKKVTPFGLQSAYLRFRIELYQLGVRAALKLREYELALNRAELAKCSTSRRMGKRARRDRAQLAATRLNYRKLCEDLDAPELTEEARAQLAAKRRASWDAMTIGRFREADQPESGNTVEAVKSALSNEEAVLYYFWLAPRELAIFLLTELGVDAVIKELSEQEQETVYRIPNAILNFEAGCGKLIEPTEEHSSALLPGRMIEVLRCKRSLSISPHRSLHLVPFHAFLVDGEYLIDRMRISYVPNLSPLLSSYVPAEKPRLFALGVPASTVKIGGHTVQPIENAADEIEEIASAYVQAGCDVDKKVGPKATQTLLWTLDETDALADYQHLHIACHGTTVDSESPLESRLILYDKELDGLDIAGLELNSDLAVLSACCSGQRPFHAPAIPGSEYREELPGDELFGLQAAFFSAGVRQLVSTMWPVDSEPARQITHALHRGVLSGMLPDEALQHAILEFKKNASLFFRSVENWAPFFLVSLAKPRPAATED